MKKYLALTLFLPIFTNATITVSGISSGGFMAAQLGVIYSDQVTGVATVAGGFYYCAQNHMQDKIKLSGGNYLSLLKARVNAVGIFTGDIDQVIVLRNTNPLYQSVGICMQNPAEASLSFETMKVNEENKLIAPTQNIAKQKVLIYQGSADTIVRPAMQAKLNEFYTGLQVPELNIKLVTSKGVHNFPTDHDGENNCFVQSVPFVSSCSYNAAGDILTHLLDKPALQRVTDKAVNKKNLYMVSQKLTGVEHPMAPQSMASYGYLAASQNCLNNPSSCAMHVAFHGCEMSDSYDHQFDQKYARGAQRGFMQMRTKAQSFRFSTLPYIEQRKNKFGLLKFAADSGYLEYVEKNNIMVLFPQTWIRAGNYPLNPKGCWDWFGWTGPDYATNKGSEPAWLMKWIEQVQGEPQKFILKKKLSYKEAGAL